MKQRSDNVTEDQRKEQRARERIAQVNREAWMLACRYLLARLQKRAKASASRHRLRQAPVRARSRLRHNPRDRLEQLDCRI